MTIIENVRSHLIIDVSRVSGTNSAGDTCAGSVASQKTAIPMQQTMVPAHQILVLIFYLACHQLWTVWFHLSYRYWTISTWSVSCSVLLISRFTKFLLLIWTDHVPHLPRNLGNSPVVLVEVLVVGQLPVLLAEHQEHFPF